MHLKIKHRTVYQYDGPVPFALQQVKKSPRSGPGQTVLDWEVTAEGGVRHVDYIDHHQNHVILMGFEPDTDQVAVVCEGEAITEDISGVTGPHHGAAPLWYYKRTTPLTQPGPGLRKLARSARSTHANDVDLIHGLARTILEEVSYVAGETNHATPAEQALKHGKGVCQDHTHILISAARLLNLPARYVSGYLMMDNEDSQDASHAWAEVFVESLGWVGIDVANQISPDEKYVRVATGLDYNGAAPVSGIRYGSHTETMHVSLHVEQ